jgi:hypothetical protein
MRGSTKAKLPLSIALIVTTSTMAAVLVAGLGSGPAMGAGASARTRNTSAAPLTAVDASNYTADCKTLTGSVTLSPGLKQPGTASVKKETATLKGKLSGCTATPTAGGTPVTIKKATFSGTLTFKDGPASNACESTLLGSSVAFKGNLTITWKTSPALVSATSVVKVSNVNSNESLTSTYLIPGTKAARVTGSFTGGNQGAGSVVELITSQTPEQQGLLCIGSSGLTSVPLSGGFAYFETPPSSIAVTPVDQTGLTNDFYTYDALATIPDGLEVDVTNQANWSTGDNGIAIALPDQPGFIQPESPGTTAIDAMFEGVTGSTDIQVVNPLVVTTSSLPDGTVGSSYDQTINATGGTTPYTWSVAFGSLPNGLSLNSSTGEITGVPTAAGCSAFTVGVEDSSWTQQSFQEDLSMGVDNGTTNGCLQVTTTSLPNGTKGTPYDATLQASGGTEPYTWADEFNDLPSWASLNSATGEITGTPNATGQTCFEAEATDSSSPQQQNSGRVCFEIAS